MRAEPLDVELLTIRQPFRAWSIAVPVTFAERYIREDDYWHARDATRSISLTSVSVRDGARPVTAMELLDRAPPLEGVAVDELPPGLMGRAAEIRLDPPVLASRALSGYLAVEGRILLVTITSDDLEWARAVWKTIRSHPAPPGPFKVPLH